MEERYDIHSAQDRSALLRKRELEEFFAKWFWILFWVQIASLVLGLALAGLTAESRSLASHTIELVLCFLLARLGRREDRFRLAAIWGFASLVVEISAGLFLPESLSIWASVAVIVLTLLSKYQYLQGCGDILQRRERALCEKWRNLWVWMCLSQAAGLVLALPLAAMLLQGSLLAVLAVLALYLVTAVVQVKELVYLYRTAQVFRNIVQEG